MATPSTKLVTLQSFQGKRVSQRGGGGSARSKEVMKSRLEEAIMGQNSARSEMMLRRRGNTLPSSAHVVGHSQFYIQGAGWCQRLGCPVPPHLQTWQHCGSSCLSAACAACLGSVRAPWLTHSANTHKHIQTSCNGPSFFHGPGGWLADLSPYIILLYLS